MNGNTLIEFINDLLTMEGSEKEFVCKNKSYFLESCYHKDKDLIEMYLFEITDDE